MAELKTLNKRRLVLISSILSISAVAVASIALAGGSDQSSATTLSAKGKKIQLLPRVHRGARFQFHGELPEAFLLGTRADRAFYRFVDQNGQTCYGVGSANTIGKPGDIACWRRQPALMDYTTVEVTRGSSNVRVLRIEGFAADGITHVQALDASGRSVAEARVTDNIYHLGAPAAGRVSRVVARDSSGEVAGGVDFPDPQSAP